MKGFHLSHDQLLHNATQTISTMKTTITLLAVIASLAMGHTAARADHQTEHTKTLVLKNKDGIAIEGYDPVAYFTDKKPVKGNAKFTTNFEGTTYWFASAEHKAMFDVSPAKYVPAFGGYCGYAASINRLSPISPDWWQVIDGRLVLQHNKKAYDKWNAELQMNLKKADANWPGLVDKNGTYGGKTLVQLDKKGVAIEGYDAVTYFNGGVPQKGMPAIEATYNGALYHFVSQENRETFEKDPAHYAPAYGGFCGYAASVGKVRPANPLLWSIVDGRLILQHTKGAADLWEKDVKGNKSKADMYWPKLVEVKAGQKDPIDSLLGKSVLAELR